MQISFVLLTGAGIVFLATFFGIRIIRPTQKGLIERLGRYHHFADPGFHWIVPLIDRIFVVNTTEQMIELSETQTFLLKYTIVENKICICETLCQNSKNPPKYEQHTLQQFYKDLITAIIIVPLHEILDNIYQLLSHAPTCQSVRFTPVQSPLRHVKATGTNAFLK